MKLLIADDESLTREGLISSINWEALGIHEILQTEDGLSAYRIACAQKPDIILSDIRMPRLSGIDFAYKIKDALPDSSLIFMSGYSDKDYFKAAIRLKAITYVEKPLDPVEIEDAVQEAILLRQEKLQTRQNKNLQSMEESSRLALLLTRPYRDNQKEIDMLIGRLSPLKASSAIITTYIIKSNCTDITLKESLQNFSNFLSTYHLQCLSVHTHTLYYVFHIIGMTLPSAMVLNSVEKQLQELFSPFGPFYICYGEAVHGFAKVYQAYSLAAITMQSSFFYPVCSILHCNFAENTGVSNIPQHFDAVHDFHQALLSNNKETTTHILHLLHEKYSCNLKYLPAQVKDVYYRLFATLDDCRQKKKLSVSSLFAEESIIQELENYFCFDDMHQALCQKTESYFSALTESTPEDSTIYMIKEYIDKHYSEEQLSIKDISEHVFLSASYICTYFKTQTGQTLNQYITEYRMERAMELLKDARYQITDISAKVGYSNGNYFGKSFKKFTGVTPSQYREKLLG